MISSAIKAVRCKGIALAQPAAEATMTRRAAELRESPGDGGRSLASLLDGTPASRPSACRSG